MGIHWARHLAAGAIVLLAVVGVSGCSFTSGSSGGGSGGRTGGNGQSSQSSPDSPGSGGNDAGVIAPIIVDLSSIDGTTVEVPVDNVVVLESGEVKVTAWVASVSDPKVAEFVPGSDDGSATFNPGVKPLAVGETTVTLTNSDTGNESTFDLHVTP